MTALCVFPCGGITVMCFCMCGMSELCVLFACRKSEMCGVVARRVSEFRRCRALLYNGIITRCCCVCRMAELWGFFRVVYYCKVPVRVWNFRIVFCLRVKCQICVVLSRLEFRQ